MEIISVVRSQSVSFVFSLQLNLSGNLGNNKGKKQKTRGCALNSVKCWDFVTHCINKSFFKVNKFSSICLFQLRCYTIESPNPRKKMVSHWINKSFFKVKKLSCICLFQLRCYTIESPTSNNSDLSAKDLQLGTTRKQTRTFIWAIKLLI